MNLYYVVANGQRSYEYRKKHQQIQVMLLYTDITQCIQYVSIRDLICLVLQFFQEEKLT